MAMVFKCDMCDREIKGPYYGVSLSLPDEEDSEKYITNEYELCKKHFDEVSEFVLTPRTP